MFEFRGFGLIRRQRDRYRGGGSSPLAYRTVHWRKLKSAAQEADMMREGVGCMVSISTPFWSKGALCAEVIRLRVSCNQNDETRGQNSLMHMSKAHLPIAVN